MKKLEFLFCVLIFMVIVAGCDSQADMTIRYQMEEKLAEVDKLQERLQTDNGRFSEESLNSLVKSYRDLADMVDLPENNADIKEASEDLKNAWNIALLANSRIGTLYLNHKKYDLAVESFDLIAESPAATPVQVNVALNYMALSLERSKNYEKAREAYDRVSETYLNIVSAENPNMDALEAPIKSAEMNLFSGDEDGYKEKLFEARQYYSRLRNKYPGTQMELAVLGKSVAALLREEKFSDAIKLIESTRSDSTGMIAPSMLMLIAEVSMTYLKDYGKAEQVYREFLRDYPEHDKAAEVSLGLVVSLYEQKRYIEMREMAQNIEKIKGATIKQVSEADFLIALSLENQGKWDQALTKFDYLKATYPESDKAFEAVLHVAEYYRNNKQQNLADQSAQEAVDYITKFTKSYIANPYLVARAQGYLARAYSESNNYKKAIEVLADLHENFIRYPEGHFASLKIADIYENVLKDNEKAAEWLGKYLEANPGVDNKISVENHIRELTAK